jgi:predicted GIY-YIG superfamily endonuclease
VHEPNATAAASSSAPAKPISGVYILHFLENFRHAGHYVGYAKDVAARVEAHRKGTSRCRLMEVLKAHGIKFVVAFVFEGADRSFERRVKNQGSGARRCPICKARKKR